MASQIEEREAILECHNAVLYPLDLEYFQDGNWLNDNCLYFLYSYYEHSLYNNSSHLDPKASDETSLSASSLTSSRLSLSPPVNPLLFLDPSIVSYIRCQRLDTDDVSDLQKGLKLSSRSHIFLPCNDRSSFTSSSTHWSLLVIDLITLQVFTLDSSAPSNFQTMKVIATIICCDLLKWDTMPVLTPIACPQQTNSYDCGVYVLLFTRNIANLLHPNPRLLTTETITLSVANIQPTDCYEYRREILELTQRMINERKRKDSNHR